MPGTRAVFRGAAAAVTAIGIQSRHWGPQEAKPGDGMHVAREGRGWYGRMGRQILRLNSVGYRRLVRWADVLSERAAIRARERGSGRAEIGQAAETSAQAAQRRYGRSAVTRRGIALAEVRSFASRAGDPRQAPRRM